ncbi:type IV pilus assembly protein PilM [bacterium]|nr:type IV pilus assembly protein PilM [bacterium]
MAEKKIIGLDFTNNEIRMVQVSGKGKNVMLERYAVGAIPAGVFQGGRVVETARFADVVKELYRTHKFTSKKCIVGVSGKYGVTRLITLPKMSAAQTRDAISLQLNQYVPFPPGDTLFDYKVLREIKDDETLSQEILLVATRRSTMQPILNALKKAGLNVAGIKITTLTGFTLFEEQYFDADQAVAFVDVRDAVTDIAFISENFFRLSRSIEFGNTLVADKIRQKIGGTYEDVEDYLALNKIDLQETYQPTMTVDDDEGEEVDSDDVSPLERQAKAKGETSEKAVRDSVIRILGAFVNELMRSIRYFESQQKRRSRVGKIVLFGNIGYLENLRDYIAEQTGLDTVVIKSAPDSIEMGLAGIDLQMFEGNEAKGIVPISLAYEGVRSKRIELNLVPRETVVRKKAFSAIKYVIVGYIVMLAWMAIWYIGKDQESQDVKAHVQEWDRKINQIRPFYDETEAVKSDINDIAPKVQGVLTIVQKQVAWIPILEEIGLVQIPATWINEFAFDANGGAVTIHGFGFKTSNVQRFCAILFYSNVFEIGDVDVSASSTSSSTSEDSMSGGGGTSSSGAMDMPMPIPDMMGGTGDRIPDDWSADNYRNNNIRNAGSPRGSWGAEPMYGLPDLPRGARSIESFWEGRTIIWPIGYEFEFELTVVPQVIDTSSAAFEGLSNLSV